jgi:SAM-dependent methyltransferase
MDEIGQFNRDRWDAIIRAGAKYGRPLLDLDSNMARERYDRYGIIGDVRGKSVLCLAGGGGQQSVAFGLLGAKVSVLDFSEAQLDKDREAAAHHGLEIESVQGDMRDLSYFEDDSFDVVYHPYSINYVPDADTVLDEVTRIIRADGVYHLRCANPMTQGVDSRAWNGTAYPLNAPYVEGAEIIDAGDHWKVPDDDGTPQKIQGPREFRHTITTLLSGLIDRGFLLLRVMETRNNGGPVPDGTNLESGSWEHFESIAPRGLVIWASYRPNAYAGLNLPGQV